MGMKSQENARRGEKRLYFDGPIVCNLPSKNLFAGESSSTAAPGSSIFTDKTWNEIALSLNLSARETQIVRGIFDDRTESTIASRLGISAHTVHTYTERLYQKVWVTNRVQLVLRVTNEFLALVTLQKLDVSDLEHFGRWTRFPGDRQPNRKAQNGR